MFSFLKISGFIKPVWRGGQMGRVAGLISCDFPVFQLSLLIFRLNPAINNSYINIRNINPVYCFSPVNLLGAFNLSLPNNS